MDRPRSRTSPSALGGLVLVGSAPFRISGLRAFVDIGFELVACLMAGLLKSVASATVWRLASPRGTASPICACSCFFGSADVFILSWALLAFSNVSPNGICFPGASGMDS